MLDRINILTVAFYSLHNRFLGFGLALGGFLGRLFLWHCGCGFVCGNVCNFFECGVFGWIRRLSHGRHRLSSED